MNFDPNSSFLFLIAAFVIVFIIAQSVFFMVRAIRQAKVLKMDMRQIRKTIVSTAVFTIAPAVSILLGRDYAVQISGTASTLDPLERDRSDHL